MPFKPFKTFKQFQSLLSYNPIQKRFE